MKAVSLWIAPQLPDLERDKATAGCFILRPGHLNLNLSLEDKWIKSPSFPCSKEFTCSKADVQQLLFSRGGAVAKRRLNQTCRLRLVGTGSSTVWHWQSFNFPAPFLCHVIGNTGHTTAKMPECECDH